MLSCKLPSLKDSVSVWDLSFLWDFLSAWSSSNRTTMTWIQSQKTTTGASFKQHKTLRVGSQQLCTSKEINLWGRAQKCCQTLWIKVHFTHGFVSCFVWGVWICQNKNTVIELILYYIHIIYTHFIHTVSYLHRLHCAQEDAVSTSHTPLSPLSGCLCPHYPHYTERKPDENKVFTLFRRQHWIFSFPVL